MKQGLGSGVCPSPFHEMQLWGWGSALPLPLHPQPALSSVSAASGQQSHLSGRVRGQERAEQQIHKLNPPAKDY